MTLQGREGTRTCQNRIYDAFFSGSLHQPAMVFEVLVLAEEAAQEKFGSKESANLDPPAKMLVFLGLHPLARRLVRRVGVFVFVLLRQVIEQCLELLLGFARFFVLRVVAVKLRDVLKFPVYCRKQRGGDESAGYNFVENVKHAKALFDKTGVWRLLKRKRRKTP